MSGGASEVLELLRASGPRPLPGPALSERLGVSRAQVWKHVEALRKRGYAIEGEPGEGYRLASVPDRLYPEELRAGRRGRWIGSEIEYFDTIDSTNRRAFEQARQGALGGHIVLAEGQTAGRGRLGRVFFSPPYLNLYTSVVLRPKVTIAQAPTLILAAAVAVADTVADTVDDRNDVEIKWPNDILVGGLKTSGILMELSTEATRVAFAILGIGVNLNVDREVFPADFRHLATSLRTHCGREIDRADFARRLFDHLEECVDRHEAHGFAGLRSDFERYFRMVGRDVSVHDLDGRETRGRVHGISPEGALDLERPDGEMLQVVAGDVTLAKEELSR